MAEGNVAFGTDGLVATTLQKYRKKLADVVFGSNPLTYIIKLAGIPGQNGRSIVQELLYGLATGGTSYEDDDTFGPPSRTGITAAEFPWKHYVQPIFFTGPEIAKNKGPEQAVSLLKARVTQAERTLAKKLNQMLFADGTGNSGKDFMGLGGIIATTGTFAGIDRADALNSWWRGKVTDVGANNLATAQIRKMYNDCSEGNEQPTHILATQNGYEAYEALLDSTIRKEDMEMGDLGFQTLMYKAAPICFDRDTPAQEMLFLNKNHLQFVSLDDEWFEWSDWLIPVNQNGKYKNLYLSGNLTTTNPSRLGKLIGIDNG